MSGRVLIASGLLFACSHEPPPTTAATASPGRSTGPTATVTAAAATATGTRFCPRETEEVGARPPQGEVLWCEDNDGRKQGPYRAWYESGALEEEGQYKDGKRVGVWRFFDQNGELRGTRSFQLRVTLKLCVFEKSSRRGLDGALVLVTNIESGDSTTAQTDPFGRASVVIDSGRGRIEVVGPFPRPEAHVDLTPGSRPVPMPLDGATVQRIVQRGMGRLSTAASCARAPAAGQRSGP